ncbi:MAG: hypothetical protein QXX30_01685 [Candidatus Aenigmatarchaeota archaeon]
MSEWEIEKLLRKLERDTNIELLPSYKECLEKSKRLGFSKELCKQEILTRYYRVINSYNNLNLKIYLDEEISNCLQSYDLDLERKIDICKEKVLKKYIETPFTYF